MICRKCGNHITSGTKCFQCGYDNSDGLAAEKQTPTKVYKRTPVLIAVMSLFVCIDIMKILVNIGVILNIRVLTALLDNVYHFTGLSIRYWVIPHKFEILPIPIEKMPYQAWIFMQIPFILIGILLSCICIVKLKKWVFEVYTGLTVLSAVIQISRYSIIPFMLKFLLLLVVYIVDVRRWKKLKSI
ncbi:MAG: hypothetical protein FWD71_05890 [Oscillospiraceae bacterium]|nr:hypothetical protein [Oscillospiraceae bacterium]